jgi:DNA-binding transcriptional ArsR family regulator
MSGIFKALADPTRRSILQLLKARPLAAGEIAEHFDVSKPTMSAHFAVLREAGLIGSEKDGKRVVYWLNASVLEEALLAFTDAVGLDLTRPTPAASTEAPRS